VTAGGARFSSESKGYEAGTSLAARRERSRRRVRENTFRLQAGRLIANSFTSRVRFAKVSSSSLLKRRLGNFVSGDASDDFTIVSSGRPQVQRANFSV